jgi:4-hydroxy-4-methyl-2-oxoglutarate aldolase
MSKIAAEKDPVTFLQNMQSGVVTDSLSRLGLAGWMDGVQPIRRSAKIVGRARTVYFGPKRGGPLAGINIYSVIADLEVGDILVIATGNSDSWIFGENMAHAAMYKKLGGIVTDARARDGLELAELEFGCFSRGLTTRPPSSIELAAVDVTVTCGGAQVRSGDFIVGDADGVVVMPAERVSDILIEAEELAALEKEQEHAIARGAPLKDLDQIIKAKKVSRVQRERASR